MTKTTRVTLPDTTTRELPATRILLALDIIERTRFWGGSAPPAGAPEKVWNAYSLTMTFPTDGGRLRDFQRLGVSSKTVAEAVRLGAVRVTEVPA